MHLRALTKVFHTGEKMNYIVKLFKFKTKSFFSGMALTFLFFTPIYLSKGLNAYQIISMQFVYLGAILLILKDGSFPVSINGIFLGTVFYCLLLL